MRLHQLATPLLLAGVFLACSSTAPAPTPDIAATVAAAMETSPPTPDVDATVAAIAAEVETQVQATIEAQPTGTPLPTLAPLPTHTPYPPPSPLPTYTPYPTPTPLPAQGPAATLAPLPTYTPYPTITPFPTPLLQTQDDKPIFRSDGTYDLGFGQMWVIKPSGQPASGLFSPRPARNILVFPIGRAWDKYDEWEVLYVSLKCGKWNPKQPGDKNSSAFECTIVK